MRISVQPSDPGYFPWASRPGSVQVYFNGGLTRDSHRLVIMADEEQRKVRFHFRMIQNLLVNYETVRLTKEFIGNAVHINPDAGPDAVSIFEEEGDVVIYLSPELREAFQEHQRQGKILS